MDVGHANLNFWELLDPRQPHPHTHSGCTTVGEVEATRETVKTRPRLPNNLPWALLTRAKAFNFAWRHSLNELLSDRRHELIYSLRLGGMISRLVVDHIAYLTAISLLYRLLFKGSYWSLVTTTCNLILVKLRPGSFFNKIILYCTVALVERSQQQSSSYVCRP